MKTIDDKDVGKIWTVSRNWSKRPYGSIGAETIQELVRKLVTERIQHYVDNPDFYSRHDDDIFEIAERQTFDDFGIDPADWKDDD